MVAAFHRQRRSRWEIHRRGCGGCDSDSLLSGRGGRLAQTGYSPSKITVAKPEALAMFPTMDWQERVALGLVAVTAALFIWQRLRPKRFRRKPSSACGCPAATGHAPSVTYHARRGQPARITVATTSTGE